MTPAPTPTTYPDVWIFDENRRIYRRNEKGRSYGSPIEREHWMQLTITGESKTHWHASNGQKVPKGGGPKIAFSREEVEQIAWVAEKPAQNL